MQVTYQDDSVKGNLYYNQNKLMADGYTNYTTSGAYSGKMYDTDEKIVLMEPIYKKNGSLEIKLI